MMICSCNVICDEKIRAAVRELKAIDPDARITVGKVFKIMGCHPDCRDCLPHFNRMIKQILCELEAEETGGEAPALLNETRLRPNRLVRALVR